MATATAVADSSKRVVLQFDYGDGLVEEHTGAGIVALRFDVDAGMYVPADPAVFPLYNELILETTDREMFVYFASSAALVDKFGDPDLHPGIGALPAVCNPLGRIDTLTPAVLSPLRGRRVYILGGATDERREWTAAAETALQIAGAAEVRVALPPGDLDSWEIWREAPYPINGSWERLPAVVEAQSRKAARIYTNNELGNARRLADVHGEELHYCHSRGWLVWNGKAWADDRDGLGRLSKSVLDAVVQESRRNPHDRELAAHARASGRARQVRGMQELAQTEPGIGVAEAWLDADPMLLNVANGTIDLRTGKLRPHRREDSCTKIAPVEYDPAAECPLWMKFLNEIMGGSAAEIDYLARAVGYTLTGETKEHVLFLLHGTGANGKTTFLETISTLMGDYAKRTGFETFLVKHSDGIRNDLARLAGARFVASVETEHGRRLAETQVKEITGGDKITARYLCREFFEFKPVLKLWLAANSKPTIRGTEDGIWRRIHLIPFEVTIPEGQRDGDLPKKLLTERPGILAWAVRGCLEWQETKLAPPAAVIAATKDYRIEQDVLAGFLEERCEEGQTYQVRNPDLWAAWQDWAKSSGEQAGTQRDLTQAMRARGFMHPRGAKGVRMWKGFRLLPNNQLFDPAGDR